MQPPVSWRRGMHIDGARLAWIPVHNKFFCDIDGCWLKENAALRELN